MTKVNYHEHYKCDDGSEAVKHTPGDRWTVLVGGDGSKAHDFAKGQNRFWKSWMKKSVENRRAFD